MNFRDRKHPRLKHYDYNLPGYYYVTIHNEKGAPSLSDIWQVPTLNEVQVVLTSIGKLAEQELLALEKRYPHVRIDKYVIMPTHIHVIVQLLAGEFPRSGLTDIICAYKSLTTRACNQMLGVSNKKLFQTSFYESVLRNEQAYQKCWKYIAENPEKWMLDPEDL
jgi:REP element-mobilizing transposase RayT